ELWSWKQGHVVDSWQSAVCGAFAGGFAAAVTTPLDVAKTRIMLAKIRNELRDYDWFQKRKRECVVSSAWCVENRRHSW
ncbi:S-adenosylmethionine mitochondrial carrier protein, partial [Varanus komodoensis]